MKINVIAILIPALLVLFVAGSAASAQGQWMERHPTHFPSQRCEHDTAAVAGNKILLYGGADTKNGPKYNDLWSWDGVDWTDITPSGTLPARTTAHAICYDPARDRLVLFGGWDGNNYHSETWEWDGTTWTQFFPPLSPGGRDWFDMVYDHNTGMVLLFGGHEWTIPGTHAWGDTWGWDGTAWTQFTTPVSPGEKWGHGLVYDKKNKVVILMGGTQGNEMWSWDGTAWSQIVPTTMPSERHWPTMVFDETRNRVVLFGGKETSSGLIATDVWEWDGTDWTPVNQAGPEIIHSPAAFDRANGDILFQGGATVPDRTAVTDVTWSHTTGPPRPRVDVFCNGGDSGVVVPFGANAKLEYVVLAGNGLGVPVDLWLAMKSPFGFFTYDGMGPFQGWNMGLGHTLKNGPLNDYSGTALDRTLPAGAYKAIIGIDTVPNRVLDMNKIYTLDNVEITVQ